MEFTVTSSQLIAICGFIITINQVWKIYKEAKKPKDDLKTKVDTHDEWLKNDNLKIKEIEETNKLILQSLLVIINHDITGNGINQLKSARDDIQAYLINK